MLDRYKYAAEKLVTKINEMYYNLRCAGAPEWQDLGVKDDDVLLHEVDRLESFCQYVILSWKWQAKVLKTQLWHALAIHLPESSPKLRANTLLKDCPPDFLSSREEGLIAIIKYLLQDHVPTKLDEIKQILDEIDLPKIDWADGYHYLYPRNSI